MPDEEQVINFIFASPDGQEYVLVLVESRPWSERGVINQLADRINSCVDFVIDSELVARYPEAAGRSVRIHVDHLVPADPNAEDLFARAREAVAQHGIQFSADLLEQKPRRPKLWRRRASRNAE
jgi:uncharacterized protein DUF6572